MYNNTSVAKWSLIGRQRRPTYMPINIRDSVTPHTCGVKGILNNFYSYVQIRVKINAYGSVGVHYPDNRWKLRLLT